MALTELRRIEKLFSRLIAAPAKSFPLPRQTLMAPPTQGVYVIYSPRGRVLHVGMTPKARGGVAQRLKDHMAANSSFTQTYLKGQGHILRGSHSFRCLSVPNRRSRALLEAYAIGHLCPAHIGHSVKLLP